MFTSAQALHQILVSTLKAPDQTKFLEALAKELGFTEKDAEIDAATYIVKLARDVEADIEQIPFGATEKKSPAMVFQLSWPFELRTPRDGYTRRKRQLPSP